MALPRAGPRLGRLARVIDTLYQGEYDGTVSIEHQDPAWGTEHRIKQGRQIARQTLRPLIVA